MAGIRGAAALRRQAGTICSMEDVRALAREAIRLAQENETPTEDERI